MDVGGVRAGVFTQRFICCVKLDFVAQHDQGPFEEGGIRAHLRRCGKRDDRGPEFQRRTVSSLLSSIQ